ncbi:uncharacterized protein [Haliotis cracherodii]|uniref:uncharacterized protein n=1 Tax=Haliotis cracherodii TaxID=6455 RepID=UPI0039E7CED7
MQPDDHPHHEEYAEVIVPRYSTDDFQSHFRLHRTSFEQLCQELHRTDPSIVTIFSGGNTPVSLEKSTMITLWYLANQDSMRTISVKFGVAKSSVHSVVHTVNTVIEKMAKKYIKWPDAHRMATIASEFQDRAEFPGVIGAIDGCHIPIKAPSSHQEDYNNRKMTHTVILQAEYLDQPMMHVFSAIHSNLSQSIQSNVAQQFPDEKYHLVGDSAYALKKWLMVPYKDHGNLKMAHLKYNRKQSQTRIVIEIAFRHLKNRFRRLKYIDSKIENTPRTIMSACVLHNFCKYHDDDVPDSVEADDSYHVAPPQPTGNTSSTAGSLKRDAIANSL